MFNSQRIRTLIINAAHTCTFVCTHLYTIHAYFDKANEILNFTIAFTRIIINSARLLHFDGMFLFGTMTAYGLYMTTKMGSSI